MNLVFDIEIIAVRDATNKEINEKQALVGQLTINLLPSKEQPYWNTSKVEFSQLIL